MVKPPILLSARRVFFDALMVFVFSSGISFAQTQAQVTAHARELLHKSEQEMEQILSTIRAKHKTDTVFLVSLNEAQSAWRAYRTMEVRARYPEREPAYYGSAHSMCLALYATELNNERIARLKRWLSGSEEGDICAGTFVSE